MEQLNPPKTLFSLVTFCGVFVLQTKANDLFLADNIALAVYSYEPKHDGDLGFEKGDKLKILNK